MPFVFKPVGRLYAHGLLVLVNGGTDVDVVFVITIFGVAVIVHQRENGVFPFVTVSAEQFGIFVQMDASQSVGQLQIVAGRLQQNICRIEFAVLFYDD